MNNSQSKQGGLLRTWVLLVLGVAYLALVMSMFAFGIDLASDRTMQYVLHITVILSALAYLLFADTIYSKQEDKSDARPALIFAALFTVPVIIGRGIGLAVISSQTLFASDSIFNFYAATSVSRVIEMVAWTTLFPMSMAFLSKLFFKKKSAVLGWLCLLCSVCCFIAFISIISANLIYLFIGLAGWGILFLLVIIAYLVLQLKALRSRVS